MVTMRSPFGALRARSSAGPLRVLWVAALLLGIVYAHGFSAESTAGHRSPVSASVPTAMAQGADEERCVERVVPGHDDGGHSPHPAEECVTGQPQQSVTLPAPSPAPLAWGRTSHRAEPGTPGSGRTGTARPLSADARDPAILRI